eukprot:355094-Chlamydomonas_euryale.AAC.9
MESDARPVPHDRALHGRCGVHVPVRPQAVMCTTVLLASLGNARCRRGGGGGAADLKQSCAPSHGSQAPR